MRPPASSRNTPPMPYRLHTSLGFRLSRAARIQERRLDEGLRPLGLTRTTWCVLLGLGNEGLTRPSDLARFVGIDRTAISRALRSMEADGFIERAAGTGDKRTRAVRLTDKGLAAIMQGTPLAEDNNAQMSARLNAAEENQLKTLLDQLIEGQPSLPKL